MELVLVKVITKTFTFIDEYYFEYLNNVEFPAKSEYFRQNKIIQTNKNNSNFFFSLPFNILSKIIKSMESDVGELLSSNVYLPKSIW